MEDGNVVEVGHNQCPGVYIQIGSASNCVFAIMCMWSDLP